MKSLSDKRIAVFGAGAVGCYFGSLFAQAAFADGNPPPALVDRKLAGTSNPAPALVDRKRAGTNNPAPAFSVDFIARGKRLLNLKSGGLKIKGAGKESFSLSVSALDRLDGLYDAVLVCVKSQDTLSAAAAVKGHLKKDGFVVSLQNGVENPEILMSLLGKDRVVPAVVYLTASMREPATLVFQSEGKLLYGFYNEEGRRAAERFGEMLSFTGIKHEYSPSIKTVQWKKLCLNAAMNPLSALFRMDFGGMLKNKDAAALSKAIFEETRQAAAIEGVKIDESEFDDIKRRCSFNPSFKTSMLQDIEASRRPETDAILGAVVRAWAKAGKVPPYCDMLLKIMNVKFGGWFQISPRLAADVIVGRGDEVLLIERKNEPYGWAVPGGFVDLYESLETAASRELEEETGIKAPPGELELLGVYSDPARDPRGHTVSAVYVYWGGGEPAAGDDAARARFFNVESLPENIAFDHRKVLRDYRDKYRV